MHTSRAPVVAVARNTHKGLHHGELTQPLPAPPRPRVPRRTSNPLLPSSQGALRRLGGARAYLKHVVSSPEAFRHGYLVVAILFSEQTSLRESQRGKVVDSAGERTPGRAGGPASRCAQQAQVPEPGRPADSGGGGGPGEGPTGRTQPRGAGAEEADRRSAGQEYHGRGEPGPRARRLQPGAEFSVARGSEAHSP